MVTWWTREVICQR